MLNDLTSPLSYLSSRRSGRPRDMVEPGPDARPDAGPDARLCAVANRELVSQAVANLIHGLAEALDDWSDADRADLIRLTRQLADSLETV